MRPDQGRRRRPAGSRAEQHRDHPLWTALPALVGSSAYASLREASDHIVRGAGAM
ncbi:MAG: hypothetical protein IT318_19850 [Anaerolineales bacterium]|nr:hypothetical protein [Anaerolineales bacterium]